MLLRKEAELYTVYFSEVSGFSQISQNVEKACWLLLHAPLFREWALKHSSESHWYAALQVGDNTRSLSGTAACVLSQTCQRYNKASVLTGSWNFLLNSFLWQAINRGLNTREIKRDVCFYLFLLAVVFIINVPVKAFLSSKTSLPLSVAASRYPSQKQDTQTGASDVTAFPSAPADAYLMWDRRWLGASVNMWHAMACWCKEGAQLVSAGGSCLLAGGGESVRDAVTMACCLMRAAESPLHRFTSLFPFWCASPHNPHPQITRPSQVTEFSISFHFALNAPPSHRQLGLTARLSAPLSFCIRKCT